VARGCALRQWPQLIDPLTEQLLAWLHTPLGLPGAPATLAGLDAYQAELEFWFAAQQLPLPALDAHTRAMLLPGLPRPALAADTLNGMLKGFTDLVLCHDGRYYVVDYKTNWLGPLRADYAPAALAAPLAESRYDLQAAIYLLALHRHLRERLPDYQCERHLGGALYLFLRGWDGHGHGVWHACPSAAEMDALDQLFAGGPA
jgi:exodeoxyribonuclease V beta subunit